MTDTFLDQKYISLLSPYLKQFRKRGENLWNFRCPLCGDSHKDDIKSRGYLYKRKQKFFFYCHNCQSSMTFSKFLKHISQPLYKDYLLESFSDKKEEGPKAEEFVCQPIFEAKENLFEGIKKIEELPDNHPAKRYILNRRVPKINLSDIYFVDNFKDFIHGMIPDYEKKLFNEPRIVLPFYDKDGRLLGVQGRSVGYSDLKYITVKIDERNPKVYGWNKVNMDKRIYVTEGPIDSMFLENAVASMDADLTRIIPILGLDCDYVFVYDCEPRNKQIIANMRKTIERGFRICIWPDTFRYKDINDAVMEDLSPSIIQHMIDQNTFEGIEATMKMNQWSRI